MESQYYEMTHDFEEENRLFQSGYIKGYNDAMMKFPSILVRCKDCKYYDGEGCNNVTSPCKGVTTYADWFCADGKRRTDDA